MITVAIFINGCPIATRSCVDQQKTGKDGKTEYKTDGGLIVFHNKEDGPVALAKMLLDTIDSSVM